MVIYESCIIGNVGLIYLSNYRYTTSSSGGSLLASLVYFNYAFFIITNGYLLNRLCTFFQRYFSISVFKFKIKIELQGLNEGTSTNHFVLK